MSKLVLTRRVGDALVVGNVRVELVEVRGGACRLAVAAPPEVRVMRAELIERDTPTVRRRPRHEPD